MNTELNLQLFTVRTYEWLASIHIKMLQNEQIKAEQ